jgi:hypothetical protein
MKKILFIGFGRCQDYVKELDLACEKALKFAPDDYTIVFRASHIYEKAVQATRRKYFLNKLIGF